MNINLSLLQTIVVPYKLYSVLYIRTFPIGEKFLNFKELNNGHGTLRNFTNFTFAGQSVVTVTIARLAAHNTFPL